MSFLEQQHIVLVGLVITIDGEYMLELYGEFDLEQVVELLGQPRNRDEDLAAIIVV